MSDASLGEEAAGPFGDVCSLSAKDPLVKVGSKATRKWLRLTQLKAPRTSLAAIGSKEYRPIVVKKRPRKLVHVGDEEHRDIVFEQR